MNWFFIAILGPFFWSISNHIDKFLLNKHLKGIGKEALILYSTLFGLIVLPVAYFFERNIFLIDFRSIVVLIVAGCISSFGIYLYLFALENEETSIVMPFFQTIPIFGFILGFLLLKETLSLNQVFGSIIVIAGALILSLEINELQKMNFKTKIALLTLGSSLAFATYEALFKIVAINDGFWVSTFWQYVGLFIFGVVLFLSKNQYRKDFMYLIKKHDWKFFSINVANESITIVGNMFYNFALLLAPIAIVMSIAGYQPIFVLFGSIILTIFFPKIIKENTAPKHLLHKISAILVIFIGTIVMYN